MRYVYQVSTVQERYSQLVEELKSIKGLRVIRHGLRGNWAVFALEDKVEGYKYLQLYRLTKASRYEVAQEAQSEDDYPDYYDVPLIYLDATENGGQVRPDIAQQWRDTVRKYHVVVGAIEKYEIPKGARFTNEGTGEVYTYTGEGRVWTNTRTKKQVKFSSELQQMAKIYTYNAHRGAELNA